MTEITTRETIATLRKLADALEAELIRRELNPGLRETEIDSHKLMEYGVPKRAAQSIEREGIKTFGDIIDRGRYGLLELNSVGSVAIDAIDRALQKAGAVLPLK